MEFPRQEYWSGLPFPPPGYLPRLEIKPASPASQADSLSTESPGKIVEHAAIGETKIKQESRYSVPLLPVSCNGDSAPNYYFPGEGLWVSQVTNLM